MSKLTQSIDLLAARILQPIYNHLSLTILVFYIACLICTAVAFNPFTLIISLLITLHYYKRYRTFAIK